MGLHPDPGRGEEIKRQIAADQHEHAIRWEVAWPGRGGHRGHAGRDSLDLRAAYHAIVSAATLAIVVVTGLFGLYLYRLVPRVADDRQEPADELAADVDHALIALHGLGPGSAQAAEMVELRVEAAVARAGVARSGLGAIVSAVRTMLQMRTLRPAARAVALEAGASRAAAVEIGRVAAQIGRLIARVDLVDTLVYAAASWRGLHRNLVIVMLLTASLHVSVAIYLGFGL